MPIPDVFTVAKGGFTSPAGQVDTVARAGVAALRRQLAALGVRVDAVDNEVDLATSTSFDPVWTNVTTTDATITGFRVQIGPMVHFSILLIFGASTAFTGNVSVALDSGAPNAATRATGPAWANDVGGSPVNNPCGWRMLGGGKTCELATTEATGAVNATQPFTWATNDYLVVSGSYLAA